MSRYVSVFIPVYNGEKYLEECINSILDQELPNNYMLEVLVTDSGSKDKSVAIAKSFGNKIIFDEILNSDFGHGKTRQRAVERSRGEYILFITQDATPISNRWLINMLEPFQISDKVVCVFGRQIPRRHAVSTTKREVSSVFDKFGASNSIVLHNQFSMTDGSPYTDYNYFFSDVNSAIRRSINNEVPFRDVAYAEDQALAEDVMAKGYIKAYAPRAAVYHSNEYTHKEYYHRKFDEYLGLQNSTNQRLVISQKEYIFGWIKPTIADWKFIISDKEYNNRAKLKFLIVAPLYNFNEKRGKRDAIKHRSNISEISRRSLEKKNKI